MEMIDAPPLKWLDLSVAQLMSLERIDDDLFAAQYNHANYDGRLFGGQVLGQSLAAAMATVEGRAVHSMHGYFLRGGDSTRRICFVVDRVRDGRRFSTRRVTAIQHRKPIFVMSSSFFEPQHGYAHQEEMPPAPAPETLLNLAQLSETLGIPQAKMLEAQAVLYPMEVRPVDPGVFLARTAKARLRYWVRVPGAAAWDDPRVHQQILAYLSDYWLAFAALPPHRVPISSPALEVASLDHAIWFHRPVRADEWLLYDVDSPSALNGVNLARGLLFKRDGTLVASTAQEALQVPHD